MSFSGDKMSNQVGYMQINEDGGIISSNGELEYDEKKASVFHQIVTSADRGILSLSGSEDGFKKLSVYFDDHFYTLAMSNKKIHVVKRKFDTMQSNSV